MKGNKEDKILNVCNSLSSASISWNIWNYVYGNKIWESWIGNFENKTMWEFIRESVRGGRVCAYKSTYRYDEVGKWLVAFDANSLYGTVMADKSITFPDINTFKELSNPSFEEVKTYKHYIIKCDIYIPTELKFIPVSVRKNGLLLYNTGYFYNEVYNDIDI